MTCRIIHQKSNHLNTILLATTCYSRCECNKKFHYKQRLVLLMIIDNLFNTIQLAMTSYSRCECKKKFHYKQRIVVLAAIIVIIILFY
jgi:hypothetical protein